MSFFDLFRSNKSSNENDKEPQPWRKLTEISQLAEIGNASHQKTVFIFKHSTSCGISRMVLRNFESNYKFSADEADLYYLDLLSYRNISNEIAAKFQVLHQSPQILVIKNGNAIYHASHHSIHAEDLEPFI